MKYITQRTGRLELQAGFHPREVNVVDYEGGFDPIPDDLLNALWEILLDQWSRVDKTTGGPAAGSGATITAGSGDVSSISLADFGTVRFDVGATVSGGGGQSVSAAQQAVWGVLAPWASVLAPYRSVTAPTVAFA